jgi:hypothetical protein
MRTKLIAAVVTISIALGMGWYVVAQETFPFGPLPLFSPNTVLTSNQLNEIVKRINAIIESINKDLVDAPQEIVVNCPIDSLAAALARANNGDTIKISGTCTETVTISKDGLTLDGQGTTTIDGGDGSQPVIDIISARGVTIRNLTVHNGLRGIHARQGAAVVLEGVAAQDNAGDGIRIDEHSTARIINGTALQNGQDGIFVARSSSAILAGTIVSNDNARDGIHATVGASISDSNIGGTVPHITTNNNLTNGIAIILHSAFTASNSGTTLVAQGNKRSGFDVSLTSMVFLGSGTTLLVHENGTTGQFGGGVVVSQNASFTTQSAGSGATLTAQDNLGRGVIVNESSLMFVGGGTVTIQGNTAGGLQAFENSQVVFQGTTLAAQISQNGVNGVEVNGNASLRFTGGTTVSRNAVRGIWLINDAYGNLTNITIQDNGTTGIEASNSSLSVNTSTISGNRGSSDIALSFGTRAFLNGNTIGTPIVCDETVVSIGTTVCP